MPEQWVVLQKKLFSRWCQQKLINRDVEIEDCVDNMTGYNLANLLEVLSETECYYLKKGKIQQKPKMRANEVDSASLALDFMREVGVEQKLAPSPENICDHDEVQLLGMVWALLMKFTRIDDDPSLSPQAAMQMWVENQIRGHDKIDLPLKDLRKSLHNGLVLCALIHRHRPSLIDYDALTPGDGPGNLKIAFEAAEKFIELEQYLTPEEFLVLDDKAMFVYLCEYFYGIARMRKFELAARRIHQLVDFTVTNDQMKGEYNDRATALKEQVSKVSAVLNDREVDNTMAGAKKKLEELHEYKEKDKAEIAGQYLGIEAFYNHLATRLSDHKRPQYEPSDDLSLEGLNKTLKDLEATEKERSVALHAELNRQIKLVNEDERQKVVMDKLQAWAEQKVAYLEIKEEINSTGDASYNINKLKNCDDECDAVRAQQEPIVRSITDNAENEKYENLQRLKEREEKLGEIFQDLSEKSNAKMKILEDHLAREQFNEKLRLWDLQHTNICNEIEEFNVEKTAYLNEKEEVKSVEEARAALATLEGYSVENENFIAGHVPSLKALGTRIKTAKYETEYSSSCFQDGETLDAREAKVDATFEELRNLYDKKNDILLDDRDREIYRSETMLLNDKHITSFDAINTWCDEKVTYLNTKEEVDSIRDAQLHLSRLEAFQSDKEEMKEHTVGGLKKLGQKITTASYDELSQWKFETPEEVGSREQKIDDRFEELGELHNKKKEILEDDLAREEFKAEVLMFNDQHKKAVDALNKWCDDKEVYLEAKENINSIADANLQISRLEDFDNSQDDVEEHAVKSMKSLGQKIVDAKYENLTTYVFENPDEIEGRHKLIDARFETLTVKSEAKIADLLNALDLEKRKEEKRLEYAALAADFVRWCNSTSEDAASAFFGFTLADVEDFNEQLGQQDRDINRRSEEKQNTCKEVLEAGAEIGVRENVYTEETSDTLKIAFEGTTEALGKRREAYAAELARQKADDQLCQEFANMIEGFADGLTAKRVEVAGSADELELQLSNVQSLIESKEQEEKVPAIKEAEDKIKDKGITNNIHTFLSTKDVEVMLDQYKQFLDRKQTMLKEEIQQKKLKGLSEEQHEDIKKQFAEFDFNNNGKLEIREVRAALFSLGEEKTNKEVEQIMTDYGNEEKCLELSGFQEFMIGILGVGDSKIDILDGFKLINKGADHVKDDLVKDLLVEKDLEFIKKTAPECDGGHQYEPWVDEVFSR